jgi:AcrR family transcriptional regulator
MSKAESADTPKSAVGRPRSATSYQAIIEAARSLLDEVGPNRLTIDGVAKRAGVGKPTIYRKWANAQELAMEALVGRNDPVADPVNESLELLVEDIITRLNTKQGRQMALMLASAEPDSELFKAFANRVILQGRQRGLSILQQQMASGDIGEGTDLAVVIDMIFGAIMLRLLLRHEKLDVSLAQETIRPIMEGIGRQRLKPAPVQ